jgi:hypothetical protein
MGLFEGLRSMLGRRAGGETDDESTSGSASGSERRADTEREAAPPGFERSGPVRQTHGTHWATVVPQVTREATVDALTSETVDDGEVVVGESVDGGGVRGYRYRPGALGAMAVTVDGELATAYPIGDGVAHDVDTTGRKQWQSDVEAWVRARVGDVGVTTFASNYFEHPAAFYAGECVAELSVFMYEFDRVAAARDDEPGVAVGDGGVRSTREDGANSSSEGSDRVSSTTGAVGRVRPWEEGACDDYVVRTRVDAVERVSLGDCEAYRIEAPLHRGARSGRVDVAVFVGTHVAGDVVPRVGDVVEGPGWLQARIHKGGNDDA